MGREESYLCDILRLGEKGGQDILKGTVTRHVTQIEPKQFGLQPLGESAKSDLCETNYGFGFSQPTRFETLWQCKYRMSSDFTSVLQNLILEDIPSLKSHTNAVPIPNGYGATDI